MAPDADATAGASQGWHDLEAVLAEEPAATLLAAYLARACCMRRQAATSVSSVGQRSGCTRRCQRGGPLPRLCGEDAMHSARFLVTIALGSLLLAGAGQPPPEASSDTRAEEN